MRLSRRTRRLAKALLPIPIAAAVAALLLLSGCGGATLAGDSSDLSGALTVIRVHHAAPSMALRGDQGKLSWASGTSMTFGGGDVWSWSTRALKSRTEFKPLIGDSAWSRGPNYVVTPGQTLDV